MYKKAFLEMMRELDLHEGSNFHMPAQTIKSAAELHLTEEAARDLCHRFWKVLVGLQRSMEPSPADPPSEPYPEAAKSAEPV
jgi:hypothetical protein